MDRKCIILGRNTGNALGQIRSFGEAGIKSIVVWFGFNGHNPKHSKYVEAFYEFASAEECLEFIIDKYGNNPDKNILTTDNDGIVSLFDKNYERLNKSFIFFNAGEQGRLSKMMTKTKQCELAEKYGIKIPKSVVMENCELNHGLQYPIFTKATDSFDVHWKNSVCICRNEEDLKGYYDRRKTNSPVLVQEYIEKKNEYILQGISVRGG